MEDKPIVISPVWGIAIAGQGVNGPLNGLCPFCFKGLIDIPQELHGLGVMPRPVPGTGPAFLCITYRKPKCLWCCLIAQITIVLIGRKVLPWWRGTANGMKAVRILRRATPYLLPGKGTGYRQGAIPARGVMRRLQQVCWI